MAARTAATSSAGPCTQPTFQPVTENVLPAEEMVSVRSARPGSDRHRHVRTPVEHHVLVHLVGDDDGVVLGGQRADERELLGR